MRLSGIFQKLCETELILSTHSMQAKYFSGWETGFERFAGQILGFFILFPSPISVKNLVDRKFQDIFEIKYGESNLDSGDC
jgi:hypothetical protein